MKNERSKFNVDKNTSSRTYDGIIFDSAMEMKYYRDVIIPALAEGDIVDHERQKAYELQPKFEYQGKKYRPITYVADFYLVYRDGHKEVIDIKGFADSLAQLKRKLFMYHYPELNYRWIGYSMIDGGWLDYDFIQQCRAKRKKQKSINGKEQKN